MSTVVTNTTVEEVNLRLRTSLKEYGKQMRRGNPKLSRSARLIEFAWTAYDIMRALEEAGSDGDDQDFDALYSMKLAYEIFKGSPFRENR